MLRPVGVGVAALAVVVAGLGPAAATTGEADLPAPSGLSVNGERCGTEPLVTTLASESYYTVRLDFAFDDAQVTTARVEVIEQDGDVRMNAAKVSVQDGQGRVGLARGFSGIKEGVQYTYRVRAVTPEGEAGQPLECSFSLRIGPRWPDLLPVLGKPALYPTSENGGGVGVLGAFVAVPKEQGDAVAFEYGFTDADSVRPTELTRVEAGEDGTAEIPVVPSAPGTHFLMVVGIDADGLRGAWETRRFQVSSGSAIRPAPALTVSEPADGVPGDGRIPVDINLSPQLQAWDGAVRPMGEVSLRLGDVELARATFDAASERVLLDEAALGAGFRDLRMEYRQFAGAEPVVGTARICGGSCSFSGGKAAVASETGGKVSLATDLTAKASGFSPAPSSYTYQWMRDGKTLKGATKKNYLSVPTDQGHRLSVKVTAHGPRMTARSVTSPSVLVGDRDEMHSYYEISYVRSRYAPDYAFDGSPAGAPGSGGAIETLGVRVSSRAYPGSWIGDEVVEPIELTTSGYVQGRGWTSASRSTVGSPGSGRRLEAIRIAKAGPIAAYYDVFYRVYVPKRGWLGWATNGGTSGTIGYGSRIEAVQVKVLRKGSRPAASGSGNAPYYSRATQKQVRVEAFMQPSKTWRSPVGGGSTAGRTDKLSAPRRLNAVRVDLDGRYSGGVQVSAKVKGDGWRPYVRNDRTAGATRLARPTSAYRMRLTGGMADRYRLYYRTYVQGIGWLGWAHDGAASGTASYTKRPTAVQVLLVPKGEAAPRSGYGRAAYRR